MASLNAYAQSLRSDKPATKAYEEGVPFFVPQLSKVKTSVMCQGKTQKLLFKYETGGAFTSPLSPKVLPYRKQGNHNPDVLQAIERFWVTFPCIRQGGEAIPMHDYVDVFMKFYKALVAPSEFSIGEARYIVEKDWAKDSIDGENMSKLLFFGSLFEVADIWTIDIGAEQYVAFLNKLFERVTMIIYDHVKLQWFTAFAELDKIRSFDDPTPPDEDPSTQNLSSNEKATRWLQCLMSPGHHLLGRIHDRQMDCYHHLIQSRGHWKMNVFRYLHQHRRLGSSISDDFDHNSRDHLFERGPTKTRLEQVLEDKRTRTDGDMRLASHSEHLLEPDLTGVHDAERAARRRLRQKAKLVMRLRRITY
ncbi:hypothetical protein GQ600_7812 [Phytophthora cactorum]|nr:hypothetical protein GQ600_7812 [Phytophthora cactorum]